MSNNHKSLKASFWDGVFASIMLGFTVNYITPFALLLGAKSFQIGLLSSLPQLFGSIVQLKSAEIVERLKSRVKVISSFIFLQALTWLFIYSVIFLPEKIQVKAFILLVIINTIFVSMATPVWASLMGDTVDKTIYGKYFSWRGKTLGFVNLASNFIAGFLLFVVKDKIMGFVMLFTVAGISRIISGVYLTKMDDVHIGNGAANRFNYWQFIRRVRRSNFVKFVFYVSLINFATFVAAPFFPVYMLDELKFKYSIYTVLTTASAFSGLALLPFWGRFADRFGNAKVLKLTGKLVVTTPLLWLFSRNPVYLIVANAFAGYVWAGFNLAAVNFVFDASSKEVRTRCFAYLNFTNGIFIFLGALVGGWLATHLPGIIFGSGLLTLFLISGIMRLAVVLFLGNSFKEVRKVL